MRGSRLRMRRVTPSRFQYYQVVPMVLYLYTCTCTYMYVKVSSFYLMFYNLLFTDTDTDTTGTRTRVDRCAVRSTDIPWGPLDMMCTYIHTYTCMCTSPIQVCTRVY